MRLRELVGHDEQDVGTTRRDRLFLDEDHEGVGQHAVVRHRLGGRRSASRPPGVHVGDVHQHARRGRFCGSTNVRMFVTPSGPKNSSRFGDASQCLVSLTS